MGRQQYLIRLALGRSPYEAPESSNSNTLSRTTETAQTREISNCSGGYVQQYDERGHPTFPRSKALARDLRRAKNDVLSTMGVVVSGETGRPATSRDKKRIKNITSENDYGLLLVALDRFTDFFGSWSITGLSSRVQTFKRYSSGSLWDIVRSEIHEIGWTGVLFAGVPTWQATVILSICRANLFEPLIATLQKTLTSQFDVCSSSLVQNSFSLIRLSTRALFFMLEEQTHIFCFLQTLHLIPHSCFPTASFLMPFTESSLIRYPTFPTTFSPAAFGQLASELFVGPVVIYIAYTTLRGFTDDRIYRIIRRQLPKQGQPDELSIQIAVENDLLDWTAPGAGRNSEYETYRSNLSVLEDIKEEFRELKKQVLNWLGWKRETSSDIKSSNCPARDAPDTVHNRNRDHFEAERQERDGAMMNTPVQPSFNTNQGQILANEQLTHSPTQITPVSLDGLRPVGRTEADSNIRQDGMETSWLPFQDSQQRSRSNTLFSRPASPESPLTSPRIRASLTHQNSFTTTMEISLQSSRNMQRTEHVSANVANLDTDTPDLLNFRLDSLYNIDELRTLEREAGELVEVGDIERAIAEGDIPFPLPRLDSILPPFRLTEMIGGLPTIEDTEREARERDGLEDLHAETPNVSQAGQPPDNPDVGADDALGGLSDENTLIPAMPGTAQLTVLPDTVEEPLHSPTRQENMDVISVAGTQDLLPRSPPRDRPSSEQQRQGNDPGKQRVTVLSSLLVDGIAHQLASTITTILFVPFRSLFYRTLATGYLSSPAAAVFSRNVAVSTTDIRSLNGFAGGGNRHDMIAYVGKVATIIAIHTAFSGSILSISSTVAIQMGKRMFGWGQP